MLIRATLKLQNDKMIAARVQLGLTMNQLAERSGVPIRDVYELQRLNYSVSRAEDKATALSAVLGIPADDIVPPDAAGKKCESTFVRRFNANAGELIELRNNRNVLPDPCEMAAQNERDTELPAAFKAILATLTYREREIIKLRFGIGHDHTYTLDEVGRIFKVRRERVRQVEAKAIRKMMHPVRARRLEKFLEPTDGAA